MPASTLAMAGQRLQTVGLPPGQRQDTEQRTNQPRVGERVCLQIHLCADIRSTPSQDSSRFRQPCHLRSSSGLQPDSPHASVSCVLRRNCLQTLHSCRRVVPARTGDGSDNFFQTTRRGACRASMSREFEQILSDPCRQGRYWTRRLQSTGDSNVTSRAHPQRVSHGRSMEEQSADVASYHPILPV